MKTTIILALALVASAAIAQRKPIRIKPNNNGGTTYVAITLPLFKHFKHSK